MQQHRIDMLDGDGEIIEHFAGVEDFAPSSCLARTRACIARPEFDREFGWLPWLMRARLSSARCSFMTPGHDAAQGGHPTKNSRR